MSNLDDLMAKVAARRGLPPPTLRRAIRESAGVSQQDVAAALGCHRETVSRWETGERSPNGELLAAYVRLLAELRESAS